MKGLVALALTLLLCGAALPVVHGAFGDRLLCRDVPITSDMWSAILNWLNACSPIEDVNYPIQASFEDPMMPLCPANCLAARRNLSATYPQLTCECDLREYLLGATPLSQSQCDSNIKGSLTGCRGICGTGTGTGGDPNRCLCSNNSLECVRFLAFPRIPPDEQELATRINRIRIVDGGIKFLYATAISQYRNLSHLDLTSNILSVLPPVFTASTQLVTLTLDNNQLTRIYPGAFDPLTNLVTLSLRNNLLSQLDATMFARLSKVTTLSLDSNPLERIAPGTFDALVALRTLSMQSACPASVPDTLLARLTALNWLQITSSPLRDLPYMPPNLITLLIFDNKISRLREASFRNLTGLVQLSMFGNRISRVESGVWNSLTALGGRLDMNSNPTTCQFYGALVLCNCSAGTINNGDWCQPLDCGSLGPLPAGVNATCGPDTAFGGDNCQAVCLPGYAGSPATFQCSTAGRWAGQILCQLVPECTLEGGTSSLRLEQLTSTQGAALSFNLPTVRFTSANLSQPLRYLQPTLFSELCLIINATTGTVQGQLCGAGTFTDVPLFITGAVRGAACNVSVLLNLRIFSPVAIQMEGAIAPNDPSPFNGKATSNAFYTAGATFTATGGDGSYTFFGDADELPPGLSVSADSGLLTGIPTQAGIFSVQISVRDGSGATQAWPRLSLHVAEALVRSEVPHTATQMWGFCHPIPVFAGGRPLPGQVPYDFALEYNPSQLSLVVDGANSTICGRSTLNGTFAYVLAVRDLNGASIRTQYDLRVSPAMRVRSLNRLPPATVGRRAAQSDDVVVLGDDPLSVGAPVVAVATELRAGQTATVRLNEAIEPTASVEIDGGLQPLTFQLLNGPAGLRADSTGSIRGNAVEMGTFLMTLRVEDSNGAILDVATYNLVVEQAAQPSSSSTVGENQVAIGVSIAAFVLICVALLGFLIQRRLKKRHEDRNRAEVKLLDELNFFGEGFQPKSTKSIRFENLKIITALGNGSFGVVLKVQMPGKDNHYFALKMLLRERDDEDSLTHLRAEGVILNEMEHENVCGLIGVCPGEHFALVMPYFEFGSLEKFLTEHIVDANRKLRFMIDVANGLDYLHNEKGIVHADLACRNVLVDGSYKCSIADFGLSKHLRAKRREHPHGSVVDRADAQYGADARGGLLLKDSDNAPKNDRGFISIRWTAPEGRHGVFSVKSDSYSFGMVMWEIMTCQHPFPRHEPDAVEALVNDANVDIGEHLPRPVACKEQLYNLMRQCWSRQPELRPLIVSLRTELQAMLDNAQREHLHAAPPGGAPWSLSGDETLRHARDDHNPAAPAAAAAAAAAGNALHYPGQPLPQDFLQAEANPQLYPLPEFPRRSMQEIRRHEQYIRRITQDYQTLQQNARQQQPPPAGLLSHLVNPIKSFFNATGWRNGQAHAQRQGEYLGLPPPQQRPAAQPLQEVEGNAAPADDIHVVTQV